MRFSICIRFCLQNHAVLFQQRLCRCHRIHTLGVLYRGKFLGAVYLKRQTAVLHMHHIQHQRLELVAVGRVRLYQLALFVQMCDLLVCISASTRNR